MKKIMLTLLVAASMSIAQASPSIQASDLNQIFSKNISENSVINLLSKQEMGSTKGEFWFGNFGFWLFPQRNIFTNPYQPNFYCQNHNGTMMCF